MGETGQVWKARLRSDANGSTFALKLPHSTIVTPASRFCIAQEMHAQSLIAGLAGFRQVFEGDLGANPWIRLEWLEDEAPIGKGVERPLDISINIVDQFLQICGRLAERELAQPDLHRANLFVSKQNKVWLIDCTDVTWRYGPSHYEYMVLPSPARDHPLRGLWHGIDHRFTAAMALEFFVMSLTGMSRPTPRKKAYFFEKDLPVVDVDLVKRELASRMSLAHGDRIAELLQPHLVPRFSSHQAVVAFLSDTIGATFTADGNLEKTQPSRSPPALLLDYCFGEPLGFTEPILADSEVLRSVEFCERLEKERGENGLYFSTRLPRVTAMKDTVLACEIMRSMVLWCNLGRNDWRLFSATRHQPAVLDYYIESETHKFAAPPSLNDLVEGNAQWIEKLIPEFKRVCWFIDNWDARNDTDDDFIKLLCRRLRGTEFRLVLS